MGGSLHQDACSGNVLSQISRFRVTYFDCLWQAQPKKISGQFSPMCALKVVTRRSLSASGRSVKIYRLSIQGQHLVSLAEKGIADATSSTTDVHVPDLITEANVWVPLPIVHRSLPGLVKKGDEGAILRVSSLPVEN